MDIVRPQSLANNIIAVDGFSGTGKSLMMPLLCHLEGGELWQIDTKTERIALLDFFKKIDNKAAQALIQMAFDERLYDLQISRNINFREFDDSSVQNNLMFDKYNKRIKNPKEREYIVNRVKKQQPLYVTDIHYIFGYTNIYIKALFKRLEAYIIMMRNPTHLIKAFFNQNLQQRIGNDPMELTLCIQYKGINIPYFAIDYKDEYSNINDLEKTILFVYHHGLRVRKMYNSLSKEEQSKIHFIPFENLIKDHNKYIDKILKTSNRKRSDTFVKIENFLNLPRPQEEINYNLINDLQKECGLKIDQKYQKLIDIMIEEYKIILEKY